MQKEERRNTFKMWKGKPFLTGEWKIHSTGGTQSYRFIIIISFHFMSSRKWEPELWGWCAQSFSSTELLKDAQKAFCSPKSQVLLEYKPGFLGFWSEESQSGIIQTYLCSWVQNDPVTSITVFLWMNSQETGTDQCQSRPNPVMPQLHLRFKRQIS